MPAGGLSKKSRMYTKCCKQRRAGAHFLILESMGSYPTDGAPTCAITY